MGWLASALTALGLYLNGRKNAACWPVWIVGNVLWLVVYVPQRDWPVVSVNAVFLVMNAAGWIQWRKSK